MLVSRRSLLKGVAAAGGAAVLPRRAGAREPREPLPEAVGMLYDATRCVGCGACVAACKEANGLPFGDDAPRELDHATKSVVKSYPVGGAPAFVKRQCMHCVDPSCVSVCMLGALHKEGEGKRDMGGERKGSGIVLYDKGLCLGCRYCQIACAFAVPRFEWREAFPAIVKCELCRQRADAKLGGARAVANPACAEVCPAEAVVYGRRADLLAEARRRLAAAPDRYNGEIYGDTEGGGTQVLYLAAAGVRFEELGLPALPDRSSAQFSESVSHAPYLHGLTPIALYAAAALVIRRNQGKDHAAGEEERP
jgi:Fe-S-cluster-containing dehydrogenase component